MDILTRNLSKIANLSTLRKQKWAKSSCSRDCRELGRFLSGPMNFWKFIPKKEITFSHLNITRHYRNASFIICLQSEQNVHQQGRIHGYPSRLRVGRGCIWGHLIIWEGAVRPKTTKKNKKSKVWRTDGWTVGPTKRGVESRSTRLKKA